MNTVIKAEDMRNELIVDFVRYRDALRALDVVDTTLAVSVTAKIAECDGDLRSLYNLESILPANSSACYNVRVAIVAAEKREASHEP